MHRPNWILNLPFHFTSGPYTTFDPELNRETEASAESLGSDISKFLKGNLILNLHTKNLYAHTYFA